jgi:xanthine dehydrogenase molybdopterin-binding subunit B
MFTIESIIDNISQKLKMKCQIIRELNFYKINEKTFYNKTIEDNFQIKKMWNFLIEKINLEKIENEISIFNSSNQFKKRGFSLIPVKFGIGFPASFLNQSNCLVNIYTDGTVLISHGGVEMGFYFYLY